MRPRGDGKDKDPNYTRRTKKARKGRHGKIEGNDSASAGASVGKPGGSWHGGERATKKTTADGKGTGTVCKERPVTTVAKKKCKRE